MLSALMLTWLLSTLLATMIATWFGKRPSAIDSTRTKWLVAIIANRIETPRSGDAVVASVDEHVAMLGDAERVQQAERPRRLLTETRPLVAEASEAGRAGAQRSTMSSSVRTIGWRVHGRRRTARGPPWTQVARTREDETRTPDWREKC